MALNPFFSDAAVIADVGAITVLCNTGTINIYTGSQPTDANTAIGAQTLLVTLTYSATAFGTPAASGSAGSRVVTATANSITAGTAGNTGTAAWFRVLESNGTSVVYDGSVGTGTNDMVLNTTSIVSGGNVAITSGTITQTE
jgi:hypothetical protein